MTETSGDSLWFPVLFFLTVLTPLWFWIHCVSAGESVITIPGICVVDTEHSYVKILAPYVKVEYWGQEEAEKFINANLK